MSKLIDREDYLKAKGLWYLAKEHCKKFEELDVALNELLGLEISSHVSDSLWQEGDSLEEALKREKISPAEE